MAEEELSDEARRKQLRDQVAQTMLNELEEAGAAGQTWLELAPAARRAHPGVERHIPVAAIRSLFRRGQALKANLGGQERWFAAEYAPVATPPASVPEAPETQAVEVSLTSSFLEGIGEDAATRSERHLLRALQEIRRAKTLTLLLRNPRTGTEVQVEFTAGEPLELEVVS